MAAETSQRPPWRLWAAVLVLSLSSGFHFGFQLVITNPAQDAFMAFTRDSMSKGDDEIVPTEEEVSEMWSLTVSLMFFGSLVGAFAIQFLADSLGRKRTNLLTTIGMAACCALAIASYFMTSLYLLIVSRVIMGALMAVSVGVVPVYVSEISPDSHRGVISLSTALFIQASIVVASIVAMPQLLGTVTSWWMLYAGELVLFIVIIIALHFLPESPSFLVSKNKAEEAANSLNFYHGLRGSDLSSKVAELQNQQADSPPTVGILKVWTKKETIIPTLNGCVVMFGMIVSGVVVINAYAVKILQDVGLSQTAAAWGNVGICTVMVLGVALSSLFIDRFGRRPLLLATMPIIIVLNVGVVVFLYLFDKHKEPIYGYILLAVICVYALVFCTGPCPLAFFISAELCDQSFRGAAMTWAAVVLAGVRCIVLYLYPLLVSSISAPLAYFLLFIPPFLLSLVYLYFKLPETKPGSQVKAEDDKARDVVRKLLEE